MTWVQVRFWLFVCVWVVVLILVFPRSGEWEICHGRLSCAMPAVHPVSGVSVVAPLLRVEVAESPAEKPDFAHDVEGYMPARVSLGDTCWKTPAGPFAAIWRFICSGCACRWS